MSEVEIIVAVFAYWTFAVAVAAIIVAQTHPHDIPAQAPRIIGAAAIWPLLAVSALAAGLYNIPVRSTQRIRHDLKNRRLMSKFEAWLEQNPE